MQRTGSDGLTPRVRVWRQAGQLVEQDAHRIFVQEQTGSGSPVLVLHGYPSSSYDWRHLFEHLPNQRLTSFDFLGFGLSDKPRRQGYSLMAQADLAEAVAARGGDHPIMLVAHDMSPRSSCAAVSVRSLRA